jgi:hypothetical protein
MSIGKYSPTLHNLGSFESRCVHIGDVFDRDGYDQHGYNANGVDREGKTENYYLYELPTWRELENDD